MLSPYSLPITVLTTTEAFTITRNDLFNSLLTSVRFLYYQPPCNNHSHIAIILNL